MVLDLTVNTDFAQVEADYEQINLTRFSLFFPKKRKCFLENATVFQFGPGTIPGRNPGPLGIPAPSPIPVPMPIPAPPSQRREPGEVGREESEREQIRATYREAKYYLGELAGATGGTSFDTARNLTDLDAAFAKIAEEVRSLYSIAYVSTNSNPISVLSGTAYRTTCQELNLKAAEVEALLP